LPISFANITSMKMAQFDVFVNPIGAARRAHPFVVSLQSDLTRDARDQLVAPLVPREAMPKIIGRLIPIVGFQGREHVLLVPAMMGIRSRDLAEPCGSIESARSSLLAAIDYLFFGA
jgi:CcdB protein